MARLTAKRIRENVARCPRRDCPGDVSVQSEQVRGERRVYYVICPTDEHRSDSCACAIGESDCWTEAQAERRAAHVRAARG